MDFLNDLAKAGDVVTSIASAKESAAEFSGYIDTGSYMLNAVLSGSLFGGAPDNKVIAFAGEQATGKTYFVLGIVKAFLDGNPKAAVLYYDTEAAVTEAMMKSRGIDTTRVLIAEPQTVQEFRTDLLRKIEAYEKHKTKETKLMVILDSLGMLSTTKELEDIAAGKETRDMTRSQVIRGAFRAITLKLARSKIPMLVTNHVYEVTGAYVPTKEISGGSGLKYAASTIAMLSKKKERASQQDSTVIGNVITVKMWKSRMSKENAKAEVKLSYKTGLDRYYGLCDLAVDAGLVEKTAKGFKFPEDEKQRYEKYIYANAETYFTQEFLEKLDKHAQTAFQYGELDPDDIEQQIAELEENE